MRTRSVALRGAALALAIAGGSCGNPGPAPSPIDCTKSQLNGTWFQASTNETITFDAQCTYTSTSCGGTRGSLDSSPIPASGSFAIGSLTAPAGACTLPASRSCTYAVGTDSGTGKPDVALTCTDSVNGTVSGTYIKQ